LNVVVDESVRIAEAKVGIGFSIYDLKGKKATDNRVPDPIIDNTGGFLYGNSVNYDGKIKPNSNAAVPYTFIMSTFETGE
jgi:hypothetical protein